jgi:outer membrane biosynthesis protein TonB
MKRAKLLNQHVFMLKNDYPEVRERTGMRVTVRINVMADGNVNTTEGVKLRSLVWVS